LNFSLLHLLRCYSFFIKDLKIFIFMNILYLFIEKLSHSDLVLFLFHWILLNLKVMNFIIILYNFIPVIILMDY